MGGHQLFRNFGAMQIHQIPAAFPLELLFLYGRKGSSADRVVLFVAKGERQVDKREMVQKLGVNLA